jgi:hypothetical protein
MKMRGRFEDEGVRYLDHLQGGTDGGRHHARRLGMVLAWKRAERFEGGEGGREASILCV